MLRFAFTLACLVLLLPVLLPRLIFGAMEDTLMPTVTDLNQLLAPGKYRVSIPVDGHDRKFIFVTPKNFKPGQPLPIVFFLHGAGGSAQQASHTYGWVEKADAETFFVAFPEGLPVHPDKEAGFLLNPHIWRDRRMGMQVAWVDDAHFFEELLNRLEATLPIDPKRIYVTGFSNGAGMTFTLGAQFSDRIAAIAPVSSQSFVPSTALARPVPVYYLTGTADPLIPYHGGPVTLPWGPEHAMPPVQESVDTWAKLDGCPPQPKVVSDENGVRVERYGPGKDDSEILFTTIEGNGHHWPDTIEPLPHAISGPSLDPFNATDRIWDFFVKHPMKETP
jgi:polyhydroxybutyrate depolymerase